MGLCCWNGNTEACVKKMGYVLFFQYSAQYRTIIVWFAYLHIGCLYVLCAVCCVRCSYLGACMYVS